MAEFLHAYKRTGGHEGGYSNMKSDKGGETYCGISRKYYPKWVGWEIVDKHKPLKRGEIIKDTMLANDVRQFYYREKWQPIGGDAIDNQDVADFIYDWYVNSGGALIAVQKALNLTADGIFGNKTISAINNTENCLQILIEARTQYVHNIVAKDPTQLVNLKGWLNRIETYA